MICLIVLTIWAVSGFIYLWGRDNINWFWFGIYIIGNVCIPIMIIDFGAFLLSVALLVPTFSMIYLAVGGCENKEHSRKEWANKFQSETNPEDANAVLEKDRENFNKEEKIIDSENLFDEYEYSFECGYVYIISNPAMTENIFKIGMTKRDNPQERIDQLYNTSTPLPWNKHFIIYSKDARALEKKLHQIFHSKRMNEGREFFQVSLDEIEKVINNLVPTITDIENWKSEPNNCLCCGTIL